MLRALFTRRQSLSNNSTTPPPSTTDVPVNVSNGHTSPQSSQWPSHPHLLQTCTPPSVLVSSPSLDSISSENSMTDSSASPSNSSTSVDDQIPFSRLSTSTQPTSVVPPTSPRVSTVCQRTPALTALSHSIVIPVGHKSVTTDSHRTPMLSPPVPVSHVPTCRNSNPASSSRPDKHTKIYPLSPSPSSQGSLSKNRPRQFSAHRCTWGLFCALTIMSSLMIYSILQERIMTRPYVHGLSATTSSFLHPPQSNFSRSTIPSLAQFSIDQSNQTSYDRAFAWLRSDASSTVGSPKSDLPAFFNNSLFLVLANRLFAAAIAILVILFRRGTDDLRSKAPISDYAFISLSNVVATSCQYEALKWLTFPTVTIGKCAKMLPVMLILNLRSGRRYSCDDFGIVAVVLAGCAVMISSGNVVANCSASAQSDTPVGFILLVTYLLFDAITSTYQERLFTKYNMSVVNQMLYMNVTSASISIVGLTMSGGLRESLQFVKDYPAIISDITMLSATAVAAQFSISLTIRMFGALLYAGIMTTRQFCSVLASDLIFKHGLTFMQWSGALMVFSALFYKLYRKAMQTPSTPR